MKMNNKLIVKLTVIALLTTMIFTFTHCIPSTTTHIGESEYHSYKQPKDASNLDLDEGQIIKQTQVTTGVKNHEQILHTMGAVTGIDPYSNNTIMNVYRQVESSLPTNNDIKIYTAAQQVGVTKLAAEFCFQLTQAGFVTQRTNVWPGLNLAAVSGTAFNAQNEAIFIDNTIRAFWGGVLTDEELDMARAELRILIEEIINGENSAAATQRTVRGVCTATLSSAYVTLL